LITHPRQSQISQLTPVRADKYIGRRLRLTGRSLHPADAFLDTRGGASHAFAKKKPLNALQSRKPRHAES
jgi:hypothetical protein